MTEQTLRVATVQAAPAFLDMQAGVVKAIRLIEEAAANGARLVAFPECWIPGYPWWIWLGSPAWGMQFVRRYHENSMIAGGPECQALQAAAREHEIFVVMGYSERDGGSLYIAQLLMDQDGALVAARRKLKATHVERTVYGEGDGSDIRVHNTALGRVGALCCWEHLRSEEHTSELQSRRDLVCRLLLEKKKKNKTRQLTPKKNLNTHLDHRNSK